MNGVGGSYIKQNEDDAPVLIERTLSIAEAEQKAATEQAATESAPKQAPKKTKEVVNNVSE